MPLKVVLGFDYGKKRIGVAVGQTITATASPLMTLKAENGAPRWEEIQKLIEQWHPGAFIVGLPYHLTGEEHEITVAARRFGNRLNGRFSLPVFFIDERLTSLEAEAALRENSRRIKPGEIDAQAAKIITESWLQQTRQQNE